MRSQSWLAGYLTVAAVALSALPVRADQASGAADYSNGMELFRARKCAEAIPSLEAAIKASMRPAALKALAFCYRQLQRFTDARSAYQRYLETNPDDEDRVRNLLEQTMEEERVWKREHPGEREPQEQAALTPPAPPLVQALPPPGSAPANPAPVAVNPAPAQTPMPVSAPPPSARPAQIAPAAVATTPPPGEPDKGKQGSSISWPIWVGASVAIVAGGVVAGVLLTKSTSINEPTATFSAR